MPKKNERTDPAIRFFSRVTATGFCWLWDGSTVKGYGNFYVSPEVGVQMAHRWCYEHLVGPIPAGLELDHLCRIKNCVNPDHTEPVTQKENILRSFNRGAVALRRNTCKHGHEYTPENTYVQKGGARKCKTCTIEGNRRRRLAKVA